MALQTAEFGLFIVQHTPGKLYQYHNMNRGFSEVENIWLEKML